MSDPSVFPCSPKKEIDSFPYFPRMCDKIRLFAAGKLHSDYHKNLGQALDAWCCDFLQIDYASLREKIEQGASDREALNWIYAQKGEPKPSLKDWWSSYARNRGFRDDLSEKLEQRKSVAGFGGREDICSFFDFMDAEEGR